MSTIKPDTVDKFLLVKVSVGNDYVMQDRAAMQQLILNYLFFIDAYLHTHDISNNQIIHCRYCKDLRKQNILIKVIRRLLVA